MLNEVELRALERWFAEPRVVEPSRALIAAERWDALEELLQKTSFLPLARHEALADYMRDEAGAPLFPSNLDPRVELDRWQDAVEVAWRVVERVLGLSHDEVHRRIAASQKDDWAAFLESVERRKRERGQG